MFTPCPGVTRLVFQIMEFSPFLVRRQIRFYNILFCPNTKYYRDYPFYVDGLSKTVLWVTTSIVTTSNMIERFHSYWPTCTRYLLPSSRKNLIKCPVRNPWARVPKLKHRPLTAARLGIDSIYFIEMMTVIIQNFFIKLNILPLLTRSSLTYSSYYRYHNTFEFSISSFFLVHEDDYHKQQFSLDSKQNLIVTIVLVIREFYFRHLTALSCLTTLQP